MNDDEKPEDELPITGIRLPEDMALPFGNMLCEHGLCMFVSEQVAKKFAPKEFVDPFEGLGDDE